MALSGTTSRFSLKKALISRPFTSYTAVRTGGAMAAILAMSGRSRDIHWASPNTAPAEAHSTNRTTLRKNFHGKRRTLFLTDKGIRSMGSFGGAGTNAA